MHAALFTASARAWAMAGPLALCVHAVLLQAHLPCQKPCATPHRPAASPILASTSPHRLHHAMSEPVPSATDIAAADVLRCILQYLQDNRLPKSAAALAAESGVALSAVPNRAGLLQDITNGRWDKVLSTVSRISLGMPTLAEIYAQVVRELAVAGERDAARAVLRHSLACAVMERSQPAAYAPLKSLVSSPAPAADVRWPGGTQAAARQLLCSQVEAEVDEAPRARLLALLGAAVKHAGYTGELRRGQQFSLFQGASAAHSRDAVDTLAVRPAGAWRLGDSATHITSMAWSADGLRAFTGGSDGLVEAWDPATGLRDSSLPWQASGQLPSHDSAVTALALSPDGEILASGDTAGCVRVWGVQAGALLREFVGGGGGKPVSGAVFARDGASVAVSNAGDGVIRVCGLRSGSVLRELRGHEGGISALAMAADGSVWSAGVDGTLRAWAIGTGAAICTWTPPAQASALANTPLRSLSTAPHGNGEMLVCGATQQAWRILPAGAALEGVDTVPGPTTSLIAHALQLPAEQGSCAAVAVSSRGHMAYVVTDTGACISWACTSAASLRRAKVQADAVSKPVLGAQHHPHQSLLAAWGRSDAVSLFSA